MSLMIKMKMKLCGGCMIEMKMITFSVLKVNPKTFLEILLKLKPLLNTNLKLMVKHGQRPILVIISIPELSMNVKNFMMNLQLN